MKPGYKQTEVGVIPEEWDAASFGTLASIDRGKFSARPRNDPRFYGGDIPFIQTGDVTRSGGKITTFTQTLNRDGLRVSRLFPNGTLFFTIAANIGDVGITTFEAACPDSLVAVSPNPSIDKHWLLYELARRKADFESLASPGAQLNINLEKLRPYLMPVPPLPEQRAIAAALSDVDGLLGALDRLIAKKRDLKQAAMQQLLTGQTRLPGFTGEWDISSLERIVTRATGVWGANQLDENHRRAVEVIRAGDISQDGKLTAHAARFVSDAEFIKAKCELDDLVITTSGNGLGKVWWCDGRANVIASNFVRVLRPDKAKANGKFLSFVLRSTEGMKQLQEHTATSAYPNLRPTYFSSTWIPFPPLPEQTAIATVLSDMDLELAALEQRREKTRALKQGMMQELLTGRTRLL
jgi:type I restriction enzyme S subunit